MSGKRRAWVLGIFIIAAVIFIPGSQDSSMDRKRQTQEKDGSKKEKSKNKEVKDEDLLLLADLVGAEVGDLSEECQVAAASVVLNRMNNSEFPDTVSEVIYQPGQYETVDNGRIEDEADEKVRKNVEYVLKNGSQIPKNVVYQGMYPQGSGVWKVIDGEYFCYE